MRFLRYLCFYCASRFIYGVARSAVRRPKPACRNCKNHTSGIVLTLELISCAWVVYLIVLGFVLQHRP